MISLNHGNPSASLGAGQGSVGAEADLPGCYSGPEFGKAGILT